ncbi:Cytoplasmic dynein 1 light intermediate chain 2 [Schistosoma japonicum]|nr:Cytoplasmic dynein 1 light intermediate chain 2 [Schistosoma japonicum]
MCEAISNIETKNAKCLWSSLLDEVTNKAKVGLSDVKNLVIFGNELSGKSTLVSRLQGSEDTQEGFGLEYDIIEVKDEAKDATANLSVFIVDGNPIQSQLLRYVITVDSFSDQMILIVVSINEPWYIIETLEKWADILNKHIGKLNLSEDMIKACRRNISKEFFGYTEPEALSNEINRPSTLVSLHPMWATTSDADPNSVSLDYESFIKQMHEDKVLNNNLGVPMIVVVTKTDLMKTMIKENQYTEEHFDYIQMHIRRFCLSYGAALFYVSVKEDKNCDLLNRYIQHRIYGLPFNHCAYVIEGDCIFVPAGWDNHKKINILGENLTKINAQQPFSTIIPKPLARKTINKEPEISTIDEQTFLLRLSTMKENENLDPNMLKELLGSGGLNPTSKQPVSALKIPSSTKSMDDNGHLVTSPTPLFRAKALPGSSPNNVPSNTSNQSTSDGVLADFFSNLLKKRPVVTNTIGESFAEPQSQRTSTSDQKGEILNNIQRNQSSTTNTTQLIQKTDAKNEIVNTETEVNQMRNTQNNEEQKQNKGIENEKIEIDECTKKDKKMKGQTKQENTTMDKNRTTNTEEITYEKSDAQQIHIKQNMNEQSETTTATGHLDTSSDNTNLTDLKHELNDDNRTQDADSPVVSRHISTVPGCDSEIFTDNLLMKSVSDARHHAIFVTDIDSGCNLSPVSSTVQGENTTGEGFTDSSCDLLSVENQFFFPPIESVKSILDLSPEISVASAETVHVNSILPESYATDLDESSKSKASLNSSPSSVMTSPLITSKSSLKIQRDLKSPSNFDARIIKPSSLPSSPASSHKSLTVKPKMTTSSNTGTTTRLNPTQANKLRDTKTKYLNSASANTSPNVTRKPLFSSTRKVENIK